jgi:uncharacterized protein with PIN domain
VPGCSYATTKEGYLTQHVAKKHGKAGKKKVKTDDEIRSGRCPDCGGKNLEVLSPHNVSEKYWIQQGYTQYCRDCKEVIK